jgi:Ca2+-binding EF-hand superfamily protein
MEQLKSKFEKDLKTKLLFKTSGHMTEEILLLKNFKYFDEDNTNKCDSETFFQVISKVGVLSLSEDELNQLFNYYSKGQELLNYKDFIGEVFNNESLKNKKEAPPQKEPKENEEQNENEEELDHIDELILRIRNTLSQKGLSNLIKLEGRCRELDENNEQELDLKMFTQLCQEFEFGLNNEEIEELFLSFDKEERGMINYDDFIRVLRGELNEKRKDLVQNIFKHLDVDNKGELTIDELLNLYNPKESLEYLEQKKSEEEAMKIFEESLKGNHKYLNGDEGDTKPVDSEEFEDFYESVSLMIPSDENFRDIVLRTWGLIEDEPKEVENEEEQEYQKEEKEENPEKVEEKGQYPQETEEIPQNEEEPTEKYTYYAQVVNYLTPCSQKKKISK